MAHVGVIDMGISNIDSIIRAVQLLGSSVLRMKDASNLDTVSHIILPGVGSYDISISKLKSNGLFDPLRHFHQDGRPLLGICLGMQLLAESSEEGEGSEGLALVPGQVKLFDPTENQKIPHIGWNEVNQKKTNLLFLDVPDNNDFYFVHSYFLKTDSQYIIAETPYCGNFTSVVKSNQIYGVQFHPEKSQKFGRKLLENFLNA
jgi:glutamine amidotransferase